MNKLIILILIFFLVYGGSAENYKYDIKFQQKIKLRDGVCLSADVYLPVGLAESQPALFVLTPYTSDGINTLAVYYAQNGFNVVVADCRGRGNSEGEFIPFETDGKDGYDVCQWIAVQPWCNGKVGMFKGSYLGMAQWLTLKENPPALKTIAPTASVCPGIDMPMFNNIFYSYNTQWLTLILGKTNNSKAFSDIQYWNDINRKMWMGHIPYGKLDEISGFESKAFQKWILHPAFDSYYEKILPTKEDYEKINIPILNITGHFDDDQHGAMYYYDNFLKYNTQAKDKCFLIVGPWDHGGTRRPSTTFENMTFGDNSKIDIGRLHVEWFNWVMKNGPKPEFLKDRVAVYQMESNEWKYGNSVEEFSAKSKEFFLDSDGKTTDAFHSGYLKTEKPENTAFDTFHYNPIDTSDFEQRIQNKFINFAWREEGEAFLKDKIVYHTSALTQDLSLTGKIKATFYISINAPDADFEAILYEMKADGQCIYLSSDILRARYRNSFKKQEFIKYDKILPYDFNSFHFTSRKLTKGSRLRLVVGCLNSPYYEKNYCGGKIVAYESAQDFIMFNFKLYHGGIYPSCVTLPISEK